MLNDHYLDQLYEAIIIGKTAHNIMICRKLKINSDVVINRKQTKSFVEKINTACENTGKTLQSNKSLDIDSKNGLIKNLNNISKETDDHKSETRKIILKLCNEQDESEKQYDNLKQILSLSEEKKSLLETLKKVLNEQDEFIHSEKKLSEDLYQLSEQQTKLLNMQLEIEGKAFNTFSDREINIINNLKKAKELEREEENKKIHLSGLKHEKIARKLDEIEKKLKELVKASDRNNQTNVNYEPLSNDIWQGKFLMRKTQYLCIISLFSNQKRKC